MAKNKISTLGPELLKEIRSTIDQMHRMVRGNLRDDELRPDKAPDDVVVLVPGDGIPARVGLVCTAVECPIYRVVDADPDDLEIELEAILDGANDPVTLPIYNLSNAAVGESKFCVTARLRSGHRYVVLEPCEIDGN